MPSSREPVRQGVLGLLRYAATLSNAAVAAKGAATGDTDNIGQMAHLLMEMHSIPGLSLAIVSEGRAVYMDGFGVTRIGSGVPVTADTVFHMASLSKPFVATAVMQLVEQGKIDLDAPVARYLPDFAPADPRAGTITVRQMLAHTSGMPDVKDYGWQAPESGPGALDHYVSGLRVNLQSPPGAEYHYSNMAYEVLGDMVAHVSGEPFEEYMQRHVFTPLGMSHSTYLYQGEDRTSWAWPHVDGPDGSAEVSAYYPYNPIHAPSSTLHSTAHDMARWIELYLAAGTLDGHTILSATSIGVMWAPPSLPASRVAISWFQKKTPDGLAIYHNGSDVGFSTYIEMWPKSGLGVVLMANRDGVNQSLRDMATALLDMQAGKEVDRSFLRPAVEPVIYADIEKNGVAHALSLYRTLRLKQAEDYDFREQQLNDLGYKLLSKGDAAGSIAILSLNAEEYPASSNCYDSLGEVYLKTGDKVAALKNYRRSLELDPTNADAAEEVKKLSASE